MFLKRFSNATKLTKHSIAGLMTFLAVGAVIAICFVGYQLLHRVDIVTIFENVVFAIVVLFVVVMAVLFLAGLHFHFYEKLFGKEKKEKSLSTEFHSSWLPNSGSTPPYNRVNVEYKDKTILWNVEPGSLDWSVELANPIGSYLPK